MRLGEPQSRSGRGGGEKNFRTLLGLQHPIVLPLAQRCTTELSRLMMMMMMIWTIGVLGFDSRRGLGIFLFTTTSRMALGRTQPPIQWVPGALSLGVKRPGREDDHSPPLVPRGGVKECVELYLRSPTTPSWCCAQLKNSTETNYLLLFL
jgi:hypothetical protein